MHNRRFIARIFHAVQSFTFFYSNNNFIAAHKYNYNKSVMSSIHKCHDVRVRGLVYIKTIFTISTQITSSRSVKIL